jgi:hypothetical protein
VPRSASSNGNRAELVAILARAVRRRYEAARGSKAFEPESTQESLDVPRPESPHPTDHNGEAA